MNANTKNKWNPETDPFIVRHAWRTGAYGLYGWNSASHHFATESEARAYIATLRNTIRIDFFRAITARNWEKLKV